MHNNRREMQGGQAWAQAASTKANGKFLHWLKKITQ